MNFIEELNLTHQIHLGLINCRECSQVLLEQDCYAGDLVGLWAEHRKCYEGRDPMTLEKLVSVIIK